MAARASAAASSPRDAPRHIAARSVGTRFVRRACAPLVDPVTGLGDRTDEPLDEVAVAVSRQWCAIDHRTAPLAPSDSSDDTIAPFSRCSSGTAANTCSASVWKPSRSSASTTRAVSLHGSVRSGHTTTSSPVGASRRSRRAASKVRRKRSSGTSTRGPRSTWVAHPSRHVVGSGHVRRLGPPGRCDATAAARASRCGATPGTRTPRWHRPRRAERAHRRPAHPRLPRSRPRALRRRARRRPGRDGEGRSCRHGRRPRWSRREPRSTHTTRQWHRTRHDHQRRRRRARPYGSRSRPPASARPRSARRTRAMQRIAAGHLERGLDDRRRLDARLTHRWFAGRDVPTVLGADPPLDRPADRTGR